MLRQKNKCDVISLNYRKYCILNRIIHNDIFFHNDEIIGTQVDYE